MKTKVPSPFSIIPLHPILAKGQAADVSSVSQLLPSMTLPIGKNWRDHLEVLFLPMQLGVWARQVLLHDLGSQSPPSLVL